jgi:hypothetical protein
MSSSNGSNARLDRIEKLIQQAKRANKEAHARHEKRHTRHDRDMRQLDLMRRKWIAFTVKDDREQRKRMRVINKLLDRLKVVQGVSDEERQRLISSRRRRKGRP